MSLTAFWTRILVHKYFYQVPFYPLTLSQDTYSSIFKMIHLWVNELKVSFREDFHIYVAWELQIRPKHLHSSRDLQCSKPARYVCMQFFHAFLLSNHNESFLSVQGRRQRSISIKNQNILIFHTVVSKCT